MKRHRSSRSRISDLLSRALFVHDELPVKSSSVMRLAVVRGMDVRRETTSKDTMDLSGSTERCLMC